MATTIFLVRHASHALLGKVLCGRMPGVLLDPTGQTQARKVAARIAETRPEALYTSPLPRALETSERLAEACTLAMQPSESLNDIDFGTWTGARFSDLADDPDWSDWNESRATNCPPGGESMQQAQARAVAFIQSLRTSHPRGTIVAVSHADIIKSVLLWCLELTLDAHVRFDIDPASTSAIVLWDGGGKILWMNQGVTA